MNAKDSLSIHLRPGIEGAPWVIDEVKKLEQKIAEQQAVIASLRDFIFDYIDIEPNNERMIQRYDLMIKPTDRTALDRMLSEEWNKAVEECAKVCNLHKTGQFHAENIRQLKKVTK